MAPATETPATEAIEVEEIFADLLEQSMAGADGFEGRVVTGIVLALDSDAALIDVGLKSEGRISLKEFSAPGLPHELKVGDKVEVFVERFEDRDGVVRLSREKARREEAWTELEGSFKSGTRVNGVIFGRVKGGFIVDLSGAVAFLPGSQVDIRPVRDIAPLMGMPQPFQILKMDVQRNNIVVSRRAVLEETRTEARSELIANLTEGQVLDGIVKNITDYGAFVDLGGVDGLLHVTDIAWKRINHPTEALQVGETVKVQIIRFNAETQRISLGMKQLEADPWDGVSEKYPSGSKFAGRVTNITDYGAFVELEPGVEGLVHVSEMSWTKKNVHPGKIVSTSQEIEVMVLDTDREKRRISIGLKQCSNNPWESFVEMYPKNTEVDGEIKNITEFGLFIGLKNDIDGMVHLSDLSWTKTGEEAIAEYKKGDVVKAKVLDIDIDKERVSLGIKQLSDDPSVHALDDVQKGSVVTCTIGKVVDSGIEVATSGGIPGFIRKTELSRDRSYQRPSRFAPGEKIDAKIIQIDKSGSRLTLSIKALEVEEEKTAMATYGSSNSGASLGDILGVALQEKQAAEAKDIADEKPIKKPAAKKKAPVKKAAKAEDGVPEAKALIKAGAEEKPKKKAGAKKKAPAKKDSATNEAEES